MGRGEGYLRKRGKVWYFEFMYKGKRYYEKIGAVSKTVAKEIANEIRSKIIRGEYIPQKEKSITFKEAAENYLKWYINHSNARPRSKEEQKRKVEKLIQFFGNFRISEISENLIERYKEHRLNEGVSKKTINRELNVLNSIFNRVKELNLYNGDLPKVKKFKTDSDDTVKYLTPEEARRLVEACPDWFKPVVVFALNTGLRAGEIFSLRWENIDFENRVIYIESTSTKTKKTYKVPMNETVYKLLKKLEKEKKEHGYVFTNRLGLPYKYEDRTYLKVFKNACKRAGIENFRFHDLRHTFASWIAMKSKDIYAVQKLLNHSSLEMTKRYAHLTENYLRQVVNSISDFGSFSSRKD